MKTLKNFKLLIDADCPMCRLYGSGFEKAGMVEKGTCSPYQTTETNPSLVNMARAKNEIALVNTVTQEVTYGLEAMELIVLQNFPFLDPVIHFKPVDIFLQHLYKFITYNRKVIAPSKEKPYARQCIPDFNLKYRILYLCFGVIFSTLVLTEYMNLITGFLGWPDIWAREWLTCISQVVWQTAFLYKALKNKMMEYLGNMMTVSIIGTILLLPVLWLGDSLNFTPVSYLIAFGIIVAIMFFEHVRRCRILKTGYLPMVTWILFRIVIGGSLTFIF